MKQTNIRAFFFQTLVLTSILLAGDSSAGNVEKLPLAVAMFDEIPRSIEDEVSKRTFDNELRAAASQSIVFEVLPGNVFVKGAISEEGSIARQLYGGRKAEYFLLNCAISGRLGSSMKASGLLATFRDAEVVEIATISAEAASVEGLMARFWGNLDRPLEFFRTAPDISGSWQGAEGHDPAKDGGWSVSQDRGTVKASVWDRTMGDWRSSFQMNWNPAGFFEGRYLESNDGRWRRVTARVQFGDGGRRFLAFKFDDRELRLRDTPFTEELTWAWEVERVPGEGDGGAGERARDAERMNSGELARRFDDALRLSGSSAESARRGSGLEIDLQWQGKHRFTITPMYAAGQLDWERIEGFVIDREWHLYFFKRAGSYGRSELYDRLVFTPFMNPTSQQMNWKQTEDGRLWWGVVILPRRKVAGEPGSALKELLWYGNKDTRSYPAEPKESSLRVSP